MHHSTLHPLCSTQAATGVNGHIASDFSLIGTGGAQLMSEVPPPKRKLR